MLLYRTTHIDLTKNPLVKSNRETLPIFGSEYEILDSVINNPITLITGATGSGKTTQVPQLLLEAGFANFQSLNPGKVLITQPRRVAVLSLADRLRFELDKNDIISHKTRSDSLIFTNSLLEVCTEGVLLKTLMSDSMLSEYSVIILDEVHERSYICDFLIVLICRIQRVRNSTSSCTPLRLILMSATLCSDIFEYVSMFGPSKLITVEGKSYKVSMHFNRKDPDDYVVAASKKVQKIRERLPMGKILVFLPSKDDINRCAIHLENIITGNVIKAFSSMSPKNYELLFQSNENDVILATNVAEASLTIPGVVYIVDTGKVKRKLYDENACAFRFSVDWISKASAAQRMGRAGRVKDGHCYKLYTSETYHHIFPDFEEPEITKIPLDSHVVTSLRLGIDPANFHLPSMPANSNFDSAFNRLENLGILSKKVLAPEYFLMTDLNLPPDCSVYIMRVIMKDKDIEEISLISLAAIVMATEELKPLEMKTESKEFKSDISYDCNLLCSHIQGKEKSLNQKSVNEVVKIYEKISQVLSEILGIDLQPLSSFQIEKKQCRMIRAILKDSPLSKIAIRSQTPDNKGVYSYVCCDTHETAYLSKNSILHSRNPRIVNFRGKVNSGRKTLLTRISVVD